MTFLNPLYLIALAAAAIPIILHLLNLRKTRVIDFSTLSFLKELQRSKIRKLKLKQWLLLALRTLIIIFVVLAFTRPALRSGFGFLPGTTAKSSVVIVLDNSFSTLVSDEHGQVLKQAKQKANELVELMQAGDEAVLVLTTEAEAPKEFTVALNAVRSEIDDLQVSYAHGDYRQALTAASALLSESDNFNKELYIISDQQRSQFTIGDAAAQSLFDNTVRVFTLPLGSGDHANTAIVETELLNAIFETGKPVDVRASVRNASESALTDAIVSVFLNGERVAQKSINVPPGGMQQVAFTVLPKEAGWIDGFVELEDDKLPEDNRRYFGFYIPETLNILLGPTGGQDASLLALALEPDTDDRAAGLDSMTTAPKSFNVEAVGRSGLLSANLARYNVVVLLGAQNLSDAFQQRLVSWVRDGGSVLLFPDANGNIDAWANSLLPRFDIPAAAGSTGALGNTSSFVTFGDVDFDHPLFANMFAKKENGENPEIESPQMSYSVRLRGNENARQVISTRAGDGVLLDARVDKGRALVFAISTDLRWSDLPFKGVFVPLLNRSMYYLSARDDDAVHMTVGSMAELTIPNTIPGEDLFELRGPEGTLQRIVPKTLPSGLVFPVEAPALPGVYALASGDDILRSIAVNTDPVESDLTRVDDQTRIDFFSRLGIDNAAELGRDIDVRQAVAQERYGVELWKYMLGLALLCALIEMLVARDVKRAAIEIA